MTRHYSRVEVLGKTTAIPNYYQAGEKKVAVAEFSLAVKRPFKSVSQVGVDFLDLVAFDKLAEQLRGLAKGSFVKVDGVLRQDKWRDSNEKNRSRVKIVVKRVYVVSKLTSMNEGV